MRKLKRAGIAAIMALLLCIPATSANALAVVRVCAGNKCVVVPASKYCPPSRSSCVTGKWVKVYGYCSPSVGCVTIGGQNVRWQGRHRRPTAAELTSQRKCAAALGFSIAGVYAAPGGWSIAGLGMTMWGCSS